VKSAKAYHVVSTLNKYTWWWIYCDNKTFGSWVVKKWL